MRRGGEMLYRRIFYRSGGLALLLGAFMFSLTKARGYVDADDSLLGYFMFAGFTLWLIGVAALYSRYGPLSGRLGRTGLGMGVVGVVVLAVGHYFSFMTGLDLFVLVAFGALALMLGPLLFGIASLRSEAMPRPWRALPLATGLMGFTWLFFGSSDTGEPTFTFMFLRTLFAVGWMLLGYVLWSDAKESAAEPSGPKLEEARA
jgi:hypothetical protein